MVIPVAHWMPGARGQSPQRTTPQVLAHAVPGRQKSAPQEQFPPAPRQSSVSGMVCHFSDCVMPRVLLRADNARARAQI